MKVLKNLKLLKYAACASIVYVAYAIQGYYPRTIGGYAKAVSGYFREKQKLGGSVLTVEEHGIPIGTLMCSCDNGDLPTDDAFPFEMAEIRQRHAGRIGYFGKFAVIPKFHGRLVGKELLLKAMTEWSIDAGVDVAVMMVNPKHAPWYTRMGAREVARLEKTPGLDKAPAVLLVLEYRNSPIIRAYRATYLRERYIATLSEIPEVAMVE